MCSLLIIPLNDKNFNTLVSSIILTLKLFQNYTFLYSNTFLLVQNYVNDGSDILFMRSKKDIANSMTSNLMRGNAQIIFIMNKTSLFLMKIKLNEQNKIYIEQKIY
ncbi:MAG: hypothetical protein COA67_05435 [Lutibacter sp.]|nr:MAG: hypothetical protein COA67_05435 [Lutibacter sp.]